MIRFLVPVITAGMVALAVSMPAQEMTGGGESSAGAAVAGATGQSITATMDSQFSGPMAGGTRGLEATGKVSKSLLPRAFEPGTHHYRPHYEVRNPLATTRPSTFQHRFVSWRLGYVSDGVRGSYFR